MSAPVRPTIVHLEITDQCNEACPMCATRFYKIPGQTRSLSRETIRDKILAPAREMGFSVFVISGGEPTLVPHLLDTVQDAVRLAYSNVFLATNLLEIRPEVMNGLLTLLNAHGHAIQVSLDSCVPSEMNAIRGKKVFDRVVANCRQLADRRKALSSATLLTAQLVLQRENASTAPATVRWILDELGFDLVLVQIRHDFVLPITPKNYRCQKKTAYSAQVTEALLVSAEKIFGMAADPRVHPVAGTLEDWRTFLTAPGKLRRKCQSPVGVYLDPYGNFRGCPLTEVIGNLTSLSLADYLASAPYREFLEFTEICSLCLHGCS